MAIEILETLTGSRIFDDTFPVVVSFSSFSTTVQSGDVILAVCSHANTSDVSPGVSTSGYAEIAELYADDTYDINLSANYKQMSGTPDSNVTFSTSSIAEADAFVFAVSLIRGVDASSVLDVTSTTATGANSSIPNPASITPTTADSLVVIVGTYSCYKNNYVDPPTPPSGYTEEAAIHGAADVGSNGAALALASKSWSSGSEDPGAWSGITEDTARAWAAVTLALRPLVATGTTYSIVGSGGAIAGGAATVSYLQVIGGYVDVEPELDNVLVYGTIPIHGWVDVSPEEDASIVGGPAYIVGTVDVYPELCECFASGYIPIYGYVDVEQYQDDVVIVGASQPGIYGYVAAGDDLPNVQSVGVRPVYGFVDVVQFLDSVSLSGYIPSYGYVDVETEDNVCIVGETNTGISASLWFDRGAITAGTTNPSSFTPLSFSR